MNDDLRSCYMCQSRERLRICSLCLDIVCEDCSKTAIIGDNITRNICRRCYDNRPKGDTKRKINYHDILKKMADMYRAKSADYSGAFTDEYANFRACETLGIPAWKGCFIRLLDKVNRLKSLARPGVESKNESIEDSMLDLANYAVIMLDLYLQEKETKNK